MAAKSKAVTAPAKHSARGDIPAKHKLLSEEKVVDSDEDDQVSDEDDTSSDDGALNASDAANLASSMLNGSEAQRTSKSTSNGDKDESTSSDEDVSMADDAAEEEANDTGSESEDDEDDASVPPPSAQGTTLKKPDTQVPKVNGVKRKTTSQDSTASKSGDESEERDRTTKKVRVNGAETQQTITTPSRSSKAPQHFSLTPIPAQTYIPPPGYRAVGTSSSTTTSLPSLKGKTLWHISAPAGVPVSSVTSMTLAAIQSGKTVLTHKDIDYTLTEVSATEQAIFIPGKDGYKAASQAVKKSFTLRPAFTLPPEGLRMRYKPPGFGEGNPGIIGGESGETGETQSTTTTTFQFPRAVGPSTDGDGSRVADGDVRKKKKKDKKQKGLKSAPNGLADDIEPQAATPAKGSLALDKAAAKVIDGEEDEEARRKAEKKARKAAKKKALAEAA
ncbi:hypothetical protein AMS68_005685 [Peltaster fructicola]|uniref:Uncharacterized protein n=1 Tax=Peltaster fructicola TaxID=286661 RepID=A0A6H0XZZ4_9PEZI|nr:hypothetical protein AMS68_005685 [Peltaster fructicola]